jgi:hypothetical protein
MPTFAYGDSCRTGDDKYVIAQFRSDANLSWVVDLRSYLNLPELKFKFFEREKYRVQSRDELWKNVLAGVCQAEVTISDPRVYKRAVIWRLNDEHAEPGIDFDQNTVNEEVAQWMIRASPLGFADSATADLACEDPASEDVFNFTSDEIHKRAGGKLRDAIVVSARSHAMVGPEEMRELVGNSVLAGGGYHWRSSLKLSQLSRMWDVEHPRSLPILNEFSKRIAYLAAGPRMGRHGRGRNEAPTVIEGKSHESDHLQAADMAAGWAANFLALNGGDYRSLAQRFSSVCVNGIAYPG